MTKLHSYSLGERPPVVCSLKARGARLPGPRSTSFFQPCLMYGFAPVFPILPCIQHTIVRTSLVDELKIEETRCASCFYSWCCPCGSATQMTQVRGSVSGWAGRGIAG